MERERRCHLEIISREPRQEREAGAESGAFVLAWGSRVLVLFFWWNKFG